MSLRTGTQLDRYVVEALLGTGGMGRVYRAFDTRLQRQVALKVLDPGGASAEELVGAALREARAAAAVHHAGVASIFDVGSGEGLSFIVMELVRGTSLRDFVGDEGVHPAVRVRWLADIADALAAAHALGVVHRDVKPANVIVREDGSIKMLDFGVARLPRSATSPAQPGSGATLGTLSGHGLLGTPAYMAPEQIQEAATDARADQFSWGVMAYELLTGSVPWPRAGNPFQTLLAIISDVPVTFPSHTTLPASLRAVVLRALAKAPAQRFASMSEIVTALVPLAATALPRASPRSTPASLKPGEPPSARPSSSWSAAGIPAAPSSSAGSGAAGRGTPGARPEEPRARYTPVVRPEEPRTRPTPTLRTVDPSSRLTPVVRPEEPRARYTPIVRPEEPAPRSPTLDSSVPLPSVAAHPVTMGETPKPPARPVRRTDLPDRAQGSRQTPVLRAELPVPAAGPRPAPPSDTPERALGSRQTPVFRPDLPPSPVTPARRLEVSDHALGSRLTPALRPEILDDSAGSSRRARDALLRRFTAGDEGLREPDFAAPIDLGAHLALLPPSAAVKGMFVTDLFMAVSRSLTPVEARALAGVPERRIFPFSNYPMKEYLKLQVVVAGALHRDAPLGEGLRRLGHRAFEVLLGSQMGRTIFGMLGTDFERLVTLLGRTHDLILNFGTLGVEKTGAGHFTLRARDMPLFLETHHVGILEGALRHCAQRGQVRIATMGLAGATFEIELD